MKLGLEPLAPGRRTLMTGSGRDGDGKAFSDGTKGLPYPAAIAVVPPGSMRGEHLLVADQLSDDVVLMDAASGEIVKRFDVSENAVVPSAYPVAVVVAKDGRRAFAGLWNASEVVELDLAKGTAARKLPLLKPESAVAPGSHPTALALSGDGRTLYVALGNRDAVAAVDLNGGGFKLKGYYDARLPGQSFYGSQPESLALNAEGTRLYVADMGSDAVAVIDTRKLTKSVSGRGMAEPMGFIPTEWLPMGVAFAGGKLYVTTGKGTGTGPNNFPQRQTPETQGMRRYKSSFSYIPTLLHGSLASIDESTAERDLKELTAETLEDNRMKAAEETIAWDPAVANGGKGPIKHVIYIIKENRTYDQLLGDLEANGKRVGNGDPSLTMYGEDITPNQHKLVLQFGVLDNFYDSAEVSGDGHVWSNTAIGTDYLERTWQLNYRGGQHGYDYEGVVSQGVPLDQGIPDVNEPESGYIWGNLAKHGLTLYHFGEFISSKFCTDKGVSAAQQDSRQGPMLEGRPCEGRNVVKPGEMLPAVWGGGVNKWPWAIPLIASNTPTKPELVGHFAPEAPDFNLRVPDQIRVEVFLKHLDQWIADRKAGHDTMPNFIQLRLPDDHTGGTTPGGPTPKSSVADNDLAIGRAVEAISHSAYWDDTAFFILEDDAQNGADHVDAHRSDGIVVSKYAPHTADGAPFVDSRFYSTVSMIRTMETVLGLPPMNNNDALSSLISTLFTGPGDQAAFAADYRNRDNGLIYTANPKNAAGAKESAKMDFRHADRADAQKLNVILWEDAMGTKPVPAMLTQKRKKAKKDDDDD
jgi:YVTN family beta-propeller protein